jgi:DNA polymerase I-like protein with 3'-5' exonuclease and polymerase domains
MSLRKATKDEISFVKHCRNAVKAVNFALIYGAGMKTVAQSLKSANSSMSREEATALAKKLLIQKKGIKKEGLFVGGCDAPIYNALNKMANNSNSRLPALGTKISSALRRDVVGDKFITARANFNIQASGAEMLSVIVVVIASLIKKHNLNAHYVVSIQVS